MRDTTSDVIVIGSGAAGLSSALQLAYRGQRVRVFDRGALASGSTSRASGLLGQLRGTTVATHALVESVRILKGLEARAGAALFKQTGSLRVANTPERAEEVRFHYRLGKAAGLDIELIDAAEARRIVPFMNTDDVIACAYCPTDGYLDPPDLAALYIRLAREAGVLFHAHEPVTGIATAGGRVRGVETANGAYHAPVVVNAAGPWSYLVGALAETPLPTAPLGHYYITTAPDPATPVPQETGTMRDRELRIYARPKDGGWRVGIYEAEPEAFDMERLPADFSMSNMTASYEHPSIRRLIAACRHRFPFMRPDMPLEIRGGIMSFTPDGGPLVGAFAGITGLYHCAGFCGHGIMQSPVIGVMLAELILDGVCRFDLQQIAADRFSDLPELRDRRAVAAQCRAVYANYYGRVDTDA